LKAENKNIWFAVVTLVEKNKRTSVWIVMYHPSVMKVNNYGVLSRNKISA
jgi:hypothetical protein